MKLASIQSRREIAAALQQTRQYTLNLFTRVDESLFFQQAHSDFSPIGWHFGHIAFIEAYWILENLVACSPNILKYQLLFAADGLPKHERQNLPSKATIANYLQDVRNQTLNYLATAPIEKQERLWQWLIQHESQHGETISLILQLHQQHLNCANNFTPLNNSHHPGNNTVSQASTGNSRANWLPKKGQMVRVPAGAFIMGSNEPFALDNERPAHRRSLDTYWIDRYPVTCGEYQKFIAAGGYHESKYWSEAGWRWLQQNLVSHPLYWQNNNNLEDMPVCGVSYYEAEAYANFVGKRLPTEAEWEKAALGASSNCNHGWLVGHTTPVTAYDNSSQYGCQDMLGNVWEWTSSWFAGYPQFQYYPYRGYSEAYFDRQHRVLRGGSWATHGTVLRASLRNWYHPEVRQIFAGFRCAMNEN